MKTKTRKRKSPPLALRSDFEFLPIGTRVHAHHRAGVARYGKLWKDTCEDAGGTGLFAAETLKAPVGWRIVEGVYRGELVPPLNILDTSGDFLRFKFKDFPRAKFQYGTCNKTVMVWPTDSFGWIIGIMRKGIGESHKGYQYSGSYYNEPEYDPGYLALDIYVDLYAIKQTYEGTDYILAPVWAVHKVEEDA